MEEETKTLFTVEKIDGATKVGVNIKSDSDAIAVITSVFQLFKRDINLFGIFIAMMDMYQNDGEFKKVVDSNVVEVPDFDKLLKEN